MIRTGTFLKTKPKMTDIMNFACLQPTVRLEKLGTRIKCDIVRHEKLLLRCFQIFFNDHYLCVGVKKTTRLAYRIDILQMIDIR